jgi:transporter family protein
MNNWIIFSLLSAIFAALTSITAKIGIKDLNSNLATAIRTTVILVFSWVIVFFDKNARIQQTFSNSSKNTWIFIIISGLMTGLSWLFYFRALQLGDASKVAPLDKLSLVITVILAAFLLGEKVSLQIVIGAIMMSVGALLVALAK